ncbi:KTSC domain-containing protein [Chitinophaga tropicalis]|uniref:KTSC domain-containing protein n=1 Tax=Chitinophaga tropicalis TaxID=2683588 RepID=A0A7K1U8T7_9BACT|nr:KTSC domain-containing protein [Chitinophaga tropicalis]MVT10690.1 KTSC domain-containing protein [Chitinophaga tropicalis]
MPSTVVHRMHYDKAHATLRIIFVSGMVYDYKNVPEEVYNTMKSSFSKGTFLNEHIKGHYAYEKVTDRSVHP